MRRIVSFVWNDIRKIQTIGNMKKITTRASAMFLRMRESGEEWSMMSVPLQAWPRARSRSFSQFLMKTFDSA